MGKEELKEFRAHPKAPQDVTQKGKKSVKAKALKDGEDGNHYLFDLLRRNPYAIILVGQMHK